MNKLKCSRVIVKGRIVSIHFSFRNSKIMPALWWLHRPLVRAGEMLQNNLLWELSVRSAVGSRKQRGMLRKLIDNFPKQGG
jgi:hypothetical protein